MRTVTGAYVVMPVTVADVASILEHMPPDAELTVVVREGGSQRDPYPVGYTLVATSGSADS